MSKHAVSSRPLSRLTFATLAASVLATTASVSNAAVLASYPFDTAPRENSVDTSLDSVASPFSITSGTDEGTSAVDLGISSGLNDAFIRSDATASTITAAQTDDDFFSFTLTATLPGTVLNLTQISFSVGAQRLSTTDVASVDVVGILQSNVTGTTPIFTSNTVSSINTTVVRVSTGPISLADAAFQNLSSITFYLRAADNASSFENLARFDNVLVEGNVVVVPEPASLALLGLGGVALLRRKRTNA